MIIRDVCPRCKSSRFKKNGHICNGKQNYQCKDCGRQFVQYFEQYRVSDDTRALIERLLLERISLRGICRATGVGLKWLLEFIASCFKRLPDHLNVQPITSTTDASKRTVERERDMVFLLTRGVGRSSIDCVRVDATIVAEASTMHQEAPLRCRGRRLAVDSSPRVRRTTPASTPSRSATPPRGR